MGRIEETFARRRAAGQKVLVAYLCVGDPSVEESVELALAAAVAGADILELGVPFSDPTADGPTIARASERALSRGGGLSATIRACTVVRSWSQVPIVLFGYYNPLFVRGAPRSVVDAKTAGVDGLIVVDLPVDASRPLRSLAEAQGIAVVPLLAPTSSPARVEAVRKAAAEGPCGFLYYVSLTGVTGSSAELRPRSGEAGDVPSSPLDEASKAARELGAATGLPAVVGFGIDTADKARRAARLADGVVVGTALVRRIEEGGTAEARASGLKDLVGELRRALDTPG